MIRSMDASQVPDTRYLDSIIRPGGTPRAVPAAELAGIPPFHIVVWCVRNATYVIPTVELVEWLRAYIGNRTAIEVCSGQNGLGKMLDIPTTDSFMHLRKDVQLMYKAMQQPICKPPSYVEKIDAVAAVKKYKPQVVIGAFVTHLWKEGMEEGNMYGVAEEEILDVVEDYVMVGNLKTHHSKPILKLPHEETNYPWLFTRGFDPQLNRIMVWSTS